MFRVSIDDDFQQMMVSALRYALTRNSCIVELTIEYIWWKIPLMDKKYLAIMSRDIDEEKRFYHGIYGDIDKRWIRLKDKIDERLKEMS